MKLYHASSWDFDKFDKIHPGNGSLGYGAYFSIVEPEFEASSIRLQKDIQYISQWEVPIENPFLIGKKLKHDQLKDFSKKNTSFDQNQIDEIKNMLTDKINIFGKKASPESIENLKNFEGAELLDKLRGISDNYSDINASKILNNLGFDSIIGKDTHIVSLNVDLPKKISVKTKDSISNITKNVLTPQEAFDKYGPGDDRFYTSQGLDPKEQRAKINELNSKRKPVVSDEETLKQLHKETEEAAEQFYKTTKEAEDIIKEYKQKANSDVSKPKISEPKIKKPETQPIKDVNFDDILEDAAKETAEQNSKLTNRTIQNTAKKALNTKKLGIGIAVGATVLLAGAAASAANKKDKKEKKKQEEEKLKNTNNNEIDYSQDLQYAQQITNFSRGHSTYRLRG